MVVIHSAQPEAYEPRVGLAKVSEASRKVRARGHFGQINKNLQNDPSSEPDEISKNISSWRTPNYSKLHIDDGIGIWSGSGSIPYSEFMDTAMESQLYNNNYVVSGKTYGFENSRHGIFYYCAIAHEFSGTYADAGGHGWGDDFYIAGKYWTDSTDMAKVFMHELGHCIIEAIDDGTGGTKDHTSSETGDTDQWAHCDGKDCVLWWKAWEANEVDYCSDCWYELERDGIGGGTVIP